MQTPWSEINVRPELIPVGQKNNLADLEDSLQTLHDNQNYMDLLSAIKNYKEKKDRIPFNNEIIQKE